MKEIKLLEEEINLINNLKNNRELLIKEFGKISIIEVQTEKRKKAAMTEYENLENTQTSTNFFIKIKRLFHRRLPKAAVE